MTSQQFLLSQAEHCRRAAGETADPFIVEELLRLADTFEREAREGHPGASAAAQPAA